MSTLDQTLDPTPRRLIVHADDLGISRSVNEGIALAHSEGVVTSASIMAAGDAFEHAIEVCRAHPGLDVGVHLTLVGEKPMLPPEEIPSLCRPDGRFLPDSLSFMGRYLAGRINVREVLRELDAQIRRVHAAGIRISHLDSHQHMHVLPRIFDLTVRLAQQHQIDCIRIPWERPRAAVVASCGSPVRVAQMWVLNQYCRIAMRRLEGLRRPDHFAGFLFGGKLERKNLRLLLSNLPRTGITEIMCHPTSAPSDEIQKAWGYRGDLELDALVDHGLPEFIEGLGFSLSSYRDLAVATARD